MNPIRKKNQSRTDDVEENVIFFFWNNKKFYAKKGDSIAAGLLANNQHVIGRSCLLYTSPSPRDMRRSRMPSSA